MSSAPLLLVEDDRDIQDSLREVLELEGFKVEVANNGKEALLYLESGKPAQTILLDLMMPIMDGYEFLEHFLSKGNQSTVPIILLSASPDITRIASERNLIYVKKPIDIDRLLEVLRTPS